MSDRAPTTRSPGSATEVFEIRMSVGAWFGLISSVLLRVSSLKPLRTTVMSPAPIPRRRRLRRFATAAGRRNRQDGLGLRCSRSSGEHAGGFKMNLTGDDASDIVEQELIVGRGEIVDGVFAGGRRLSEASV